MFVTGDIFSFPWWKHGFNWPRDNETINAILRHLEYVILPNAAWLSTWLTSLPYNVILRVGQVA